MGGAGLAGEDVADAPGGGGADGEQERAERHGLRAAAGDHADAGEREQAAAELRAARALAQQRDGEPDGERGLELEHERGQPGRHPVRHAEEEQPELPGGEERADRDHVADGDAGAGDEREGEGDEGEAQRREQQRREVLQPDVDDHEVDAPDDGDDDGGDHVTSGHGSHGDGDESQEPVEFLESTRKMRFMVDLRRLRTLSALADHGTLAAAADALHLTPSAVSQQLAALEREVGQRLLEPSGRSRPPDARRAGAAGARARAVRPARAPGGRPGGRRAARRGARRRLPHGAGRHPRACRAAAARRGAARARCACWRRRRRRPSPRCCGATTT